MWIAVHCLSKHTRHMGVSNPNQKLPFACKPHILASQLQHLAGLLPTTGYPAVSLTFPEMCTNTNCPSQDAFWVLLIGSMILSLWLQMKYSGFFHLSYCRKKQTKRKL